MLDLLSQLVNKSLVVMTERQGVARYHFLETIRQFALDKLTRTGAVEGVRHNLLNWALQLATQAGGQLWVGTTQPHWVGSLEADHDNLRIALEWGLTHEPVLTGKLCWELTIFWDVHGHLSEGRRCLATVLTNGAELPLPLKAQLFFAAGWLAHRQKDFEWAEDLCSKSLELFKNEGDEWRILNVLINLGWISLCQGDLAQATQRLQDSLLLSRRLKNKYCVAASLSYLGLVALLEGASEKALPLCEESVQLCRSLGNNHYLGWAITSRGAAALFLGEFEQARAYFLESLFQLEQVGERIVGPYNLLDLAVVDLLEEKPERGARLFGKAGALWQEIGGAIVPVFKQPYEMAVMYASTQLDETTLIEAWAEGRAMSLDQILAEPSSDASLPSQPEIPPAAQAISTPQKDMKPDLARLKRLETGTSAAQRAGLTSREVEVLRLLAAGMSNAEIGQHLSLSTLTINTYLRTIYNKLEISSRNAATRLAFEMGLV